MNEHSFLPERIDEQIDAEQCELDTDLSQPLRVDLPVFQGFVQAGPRSLEKRRERQLRKTACSCFAGQRIDQIEQDIFGFPKALIDLVTKFVQCVPVVVRSDPEPHISC